ncbi:MAG: division/cell wall cluster transcriptional repressor MraZ [Gemmobacter sp.]
MFFSGQHRQKIDGKGRVSIPADFRKALDAADPSRPEGERRRLRIVYGDPRRNYLECYPLPAFHEILRRVAQLPEGSDDRELLELFVIAGSDEAEIDSDGRIILGPLLRERIGLAPEGGEAIFAGALQTFRIFTVEGFEAEKLAKLDAAKARLQGKANVLTLLPRAGGPAADAEG